MLPYTIQSVLAKLSFSWEVVLNLTEFSLIINYCQPPPHAESSEMNINGYSAVSYGVALLYGAVL